MAVRIGDDGNIHLGHDDGNQAEKSLIPKRQTSSCQHLRLLASITHDASRQHTDQVAADLAHQLAEVTASIDLERHAAKLALASLSEKYRDLLVTVRSCRSSARSPNMNILNFMVRSNLHQIHELQANVSTIRSKPASAPVLPHEARFDDIESRFAEIQAELAQIRAISKSAPASQPRSEHFVLINSRMESLEQSVRNLHDTLTEDFRLAIETVRTQLRTEFRGDLEAFRRQNPSSLPTTDSSLAKQIALGEARIKQLETGRDQDLEAIGAKLAALQVENDTLKSSLKDLTSTVEKLAASTRIRSSTHHVVSLDADENVAPVVDDLEVDVASEDSSSLKTTGRASVPASVILQRMYDKFDKPKYSPHDDWFVHPTAGSMIPVADQLMNFVVLPSKPEAFDAAFGRFIAYGGPLHIGAHTWHNKYHICGEETDRFRAQLLEFLSTDLKTVRTVVRLAHDLWNLRF
jgi:phage shock protein A